MTMGIMLSSLFLYFVSHAFYYTAPNQTLSKKIPTNMPENTVFWQETRQMISFEPKNLLLPAKQALTKWRNVIKYRVSYLAILTNCASATAYFFFLYRHKGCALHMLCRWKTTAWMTEFIYDI